MVRVVSFFFSPPDAVFVNISVCKEIKPGPKLFLSNAIPPTRSAGALLKKMNFLMKSTVIEAKNIMHTASHDDYVS